MSTYSDLIISHAPSAYYRLGETSGVDAADSSGNGQNGLYHFSPTLGVTGALGNDSNLAVTLNGTDQRVTLTTLTTPVTVTIEAWIKTTTAQQLPVFSNRTAAGGIYFGLAGGAINRAFIYIDNAVPQGSTAGAGSQINDGAWHHYVYTNDGVTSNVYFDGRLDFTYAQTRPSEGHQAFIAFDVPTNNYLGATVDEVALYPTALTAAQVLQHYRTGINALFSAYARTVIGDAPSMYMRLGEVTGTSAYDFSAHGLTGTYQGSPTLGVAGALVSDPNTAATVNGTSQYISVVDNSLLDPGDIFTLELWFYRDPSSLSGTLLDKDTNGYSLNYHTNGTLRLSKANVLGIVSSTIPIPAGAWAHLVVTKSAGTVKLYINSADVTGTVTNQTILATTAALGIASLPGGGGYAKGSIDEVAIYPAALTAAQVLSHYKAGVAQLSAYATAVLADAPSLYLRLGEGGGTVAYDSSGNGLDGTYVASPTLGVTGAVADPNTGITLNGTTQYISVPDNALLDPGDVFTLEAWVKFASFPGTNMGILDKDTGGYDFFISTTGSVVLSKYGLGTIIFSVWPIPTGFWVHVVVTKSGATVKIYVNGVDESSVVTNQTIVATTAALNVGRAQAGNYLAGSMDEVAIYPTALSATRVRAHFQAGLVARTLYSNTIIGDGPKLYLRLGESEGPFAYDSTGTPSPGTFVNGPTPGFAGPLVGDPNTAIGFIGTSNQRLSLVNSTIRTNLAITVEAWAYLTLNDGVDKVIFRCGIGADVQYMLQIKALAVGYVYHGATGFHTHNAGGPILTLNTWYHICLVRQSDGLNSTIYVNGAAYYTFTQIELAEANLGQVGTVGGDIDTENYTGTLDEVAVYTTAFTRAQVLAHYRTGLSLNRYSNAVIASGPLGDGPILYLRLGESSSIIAFDSSGNNLHGTYINSPTLGGVGAIISDPNTSVALNGSTQYVYVADNDLLNPGDIFTVEMWIKPTSLAGDYTLIDKGVNGYSIGTIFTSGVVRFSKNGVAVIVDSTSGVTAGSFNHVVVTKNGATVKIYINGVDVTGVVTNATIVATTTALNIGRFSGASNYFNGVMDEVTIYNYALSALQILARYRLGVGLGSTYANTVLADGPVLYLRLGEVVGPTANDSSGNFLNGTYVNSPTLGVTGAIADDPNTAATFVAASLQYVTVADNNLLDPGDTFSLEMWVKPTSLAANMILIDKSSGSYSLILATTGTLTFFKNGGLNIAFSNVNLSVGQWYHVVVTKATATSKIYVNGVDQTTPQNVQVIVANAVALFIGASSSPNQYCNATLDEVALYPTALSAARVLAHYQAGTIARTNPGGGSGVNLSMTGIIRELTPEPIMSAETGGI